MPTRAVSRPILRSVLRSVLGGIGGGGGGGGGVEGFPSTGLLLHYEARLDGTVPGVQDQSGNNRHVTHVSGSELTLASDFQNGHPAFEGDGATQNEITDLPTKPVQYSLLLLTDMDASADKVLSLSINPQCRFESGSFGNIWTARIHTATTGNVTLSSPSDSDVAATLFTLDGSEAAVYSLEVGNNPGFTTPHATAAAVGDQEYDASTAWGFMSEIGGTAGSMDGRAAIIALWDHALDASERAELEAYLLDNYAMSPP